MQQSPGGRKRNTNRQFYNQQRDVQQKQASPTPQMGYTAGSADGRYGFNGEPLSRPPQRTANGTVRRTRTDNSIQFPTRPGRTAQGSSQRPRSVEQSRSAQRARTAQNGSGTANRNANRRKVKNSRTTQGAAAQQRYQNQRLRPQDPNRSPAWREKRKKRKMTRVAIKRRRMMRRLAAFATLLAVICAGVYLTVTMLFKVGTIQVQTEDGTPVQQIAGYSASSILQVLDVQLEQNIFSFEPGAREAVLERQFPLLESIHVVRKYPNTVLVQVTEATPAYAMQTDSGWLTISDTFKILACDAAQPEGLKTLYGGAVKTTTPGEQLSFAVDAAADSTASDASGSAAASAAATLEEADKKMEALATLQAKLAEYSMLDDVTRIEFADTDQMAFLYQDRVSVLLGTLNDLDYKLDRARYVLTNADGKGCAPTDTGRLDFSHISAGSTRKIYFAQGQPTLPSGYIVPEKAEQEPAADTAEAEAAPEDAAGQAETPAQDAQPDAQAAAAEPDTAQNTQDTVAAGQ